MARMALQFGTLNSIRHEQARETATFPSGGPEAFLCVTDETKKLC
jgi:hypothetical protein